MSFLVIETIYLIAFLPGVVSWDDYVVTRQAIGGYPLQEYQSLFYAFIRLVLLKIYYNITFVVICQILYVNNNLLLVLSGIFVLFPNNALMTMTLTKDTSWAVTFIWLIRQNGWFVVPVTLVAIVLLKRNKKVLYTTVIIIVCILVSEVALRAQKYDPMPPCIKYVAGFQDMLGVYYSRGD